MKRQILILLGIVSIGLNGCNSGSVENSVATKGNPKSEAGTPTSAPTGVSPYFPGTSSEYKSMAVMSNSSIDHSAYFDYVVVGANSRMYVANGTNRSIKSTHINWKTVSLPNNTTPQANFRQVISCGPYSNDNPGVFVAVGDAGLAYIGYEYNNNWEWTKINLNNNALNLIGATCRPITVTEKGQDKILTEIIMLANGDPSNGPENYIIYGDLMENSNIFKPNKVGINLHGHSSKLTAISSDEKGNVVAVGTDGWYIKTNFDHMPNGGSPTWTVAQSKQVGNFYTISYRPLKDSFMYGGSYGMGAIMTSDSTISFLPILGVGGNNTARVDLNLGLNSISCGEFGCLLAGVNDVSKPNFIQVFLTNINNSSSGNNILSSYPGSSTASISQVIANDDLKGYYALVGNTIIARTYKDSPSSWSEVANLP